MVHGTMMLGDILIAKGLISESDINLILEYQHKNGGKFGDCAINLGLTTQEKIEEVLNEIPSAPSKLEEMDVSPILLLQLMIKGIYLEHLERSSQIANAMKLSESVVESLLEMAVDRTLVEITGQKESLFGGFGENLYSLTRAGREWAVESLEQNQYFGPAPVSLDAYVERVQRQRITNERLGRPALVEAFKTLVVPEDFLARLGPAVNSGAAIMIYGPAGNGKTTIAEIIGRSFKSVIYIPYCFVVDGQIIKVFDPSLHKPIFESDNRKKENISVERDSTDQRWVSCYRPLVITGGELTLDMLDLKFNEIAKFYEAPLQVKALNGIFLIDDFGRQRVEPEAILNRWIIPLNSRVDYLNLHTGKSFQLPFDELLIFSSNIHPEKLMDPAFMRRITYKLRTEAPSESHFRKVFKTVTSNAGLELTDEVYRQVIDAITLHGAPLAYFQPGFIVNQILASCKFEGVAARFTPENVENALSNLFVRSDSKNLDV